MYELQSGIYLWYGIQHSPILHKKSYTLFKNLKYVKINKIDKNLKMWRWCGEKYYIDENIDIKNI